MKDSKEFIDYAIKIETVGEAFYRTFAKKLHHPDAQVLFKYLADEEVKHRKTFDDLKDEAHTIILNINAQSDFYSFLRHFANQLIFNVDELKKEVEKIDSIEAALAFGQNRESKTILFYEEVKRIAPHDIHPLLDAIIEEEISHYLKLSSLSNAIS